MAYRTNPFLERFSERTTSDQQFVQLFSPKILERLTQDAFLGGVHIFRSPPGGGKTTLLRAFTPSALRAFWNARASDQMVESFRRLVDQGVLEEHDGPQALGVFLSCAAGYADLPPGMTLEQSGPFRTLLNSRIVLRTLRSLATLLGLPPGDRLEGIRLQKIDSSLQLTTIPTAETATELMRWAEQTERAVYAQLDSVGTQSERQFGASVQFEGVLWLQNVRFDFEGREVAPKRILMIDDLHKLRRRQRALLIDELAVLRPAIPVWLAERSIAIKDELLAQGVREGREVREYNLEDFWTSNRGQFAAYAQNVLDRRLEAQSEIAPVSFAQYLRTDFRPREVQAEVLRGFESYRVEARRYRENVRYAEWLATCDKLAEEGSVTALESLYSARILIARNEANRQMDLQLAPLSVGDLKERDNSQVRSAAEIFTNNELKIPYYFGIDRLCVMATSNIEELLALAAALYEALRAKQVLRRQEIALSPTEQEKIVKEVARSRRDFIPKAHTEGTRAQMLLDGIGRYCRERTFLPSAPYAPGVTGVRLSVGELLKLMGRDNVAPEHFAILRRVITECVAENLLFIRSSAASGSRDEGTIFYLNRTLCAHYGLPLQMGGWQDVKVQDFAEWSEHGIQRKKKLEV